MKNTFTRLLGVSAVSLFTLTIQLPAQISAFTYQGALTQNGQPANGTYDFMFRLLDAPINWRFTAEDARIKLTRLYPKL